MLANSRRGLAQRIRSGFGAAAGANAARIRVGRQFGAGSAAAGASGASPAQAVCLGSEVAHVVDVDIAAVEDAADVGLKVELCQQARIEGLVVDPVNDFFAAVVVVTHDGQARGQALIGQDVLDPGVPRDAAVPRRRAQDQGRGCAPVRR